MRLTFTRQPLGEEGWRRGLEGCGSARSLHPAHETTLLTPSKPRLTAGGNSFSSLVLKRHTLYRYKQVTVTFFSEKRYYRGAGGGSKWRRCQGS